jgi:phenylpyruvate tautomerase PptA (4-oxalocrotonate tautomerase family)
MNAKADRETKSTIFKEITEAVARQFGIPPESQDIIVEIHETEKYNILRGGNPSHGSVPEPEKK